MKWKSIDFDKNTLRVENAYKDITIFDDDMNIIGHQKEDGDLKTEESYRTIPLNFRLKAMLIKLKEKRKANLNITDLSGNEYVFLNSINEPYVPERLTTKIKVVINRYKLEHMTVYGFRHSFATLNSELGMDKEVLRELMGHSEFETTAFYYIHISEERKKEEFERIHNEYMQKTFSGEFQGKNSPKTDKKPVKRYFKKPAKPTKIKKKIKLSN